MAKITHKSLFTLVQEEIQRSLTFNVNTPLGRQLSRVSVQPFSLSAGPSRDVSSSELIETLQTVLIAALPKRIISGLNVTETDPITDKVIITAGSGTVGGSVFYLEEDLELTIPFDSANYLFFINLKNDTIHVDTSDFDDRITLAKIVVPKPGTTNQVRSKNNGSYDAYIMQYQEVKFYADSAGQFEEETLETFRENIGNILAENLIGNIRLSENLKITNTTGSLALDSSSMKLFNEQETMLARFDRHGTFFYNENGIEIAKFSVDEARIGNIQILPNSIQSTNFVSGALGAGFQITDGGEAEFNNVSVRGRIKSTVFEKDTISTVGGNLLVMDGDVLEEDMTAMDTSTLVTKGDTTFVVNDILRIKDGIDDEWLRVTAVNGTTYTVSRDTKLVYSASSNPAWKKGTAVVNYGASGEGGIFMTSSESNAPYISIFGHAGSPWTTTTTYMRMGNLNGFLGYVSDAFGVAIGDSNCYLKYDPVNGLRIKGSIIIDGGSTNVRTFRQAGTSSGNGIPTSTAAGDLWMDTDTGRMYRAFTSGVNTIGNGRWECQQVALGSPPSTGLYLGADKMGYYDGSLWKSYIDCSGNFRFCGDGSNYLDWNGSTLCLRGALVADDITSGTMLGRCIKTANSGSRVEMGTTCFSAYSSTAEVFKIALTGATAGSVYLGDINSCGYAKWDSQTGIFSILSKSDPVSAEAQCCVSICNGNVTANSLCLVDPLCICNYSYFSAGAWFFHDKRGDTIPYVKRIDSGSAATGAQVVLPGWTTAPKVMVGVKVLQSYNAAQTAQDQQWNIYSDTPVFYCTSSTNYGYCFGVHACLVLAAATGSEVVKSAAMDTCVCTCTGVCATCVRMKFQLWCNAACANYFYGTLCYAVCYRCLGCAVWCATCFSYTQPHASVGEMQTTTDHCNLLTFPCSTQWEIMAHQVTLGWTDSGFSSASIVCALCSRTINACAVNRCICWACNCTGTCGDWRCSQNTADTVTVAGSVPANTFCTYVCYCLQDHTNCLYNCLHHKAGAGCGWSCTSAFFYTGAGTSLYSNAHCFNAACCGIAVTCGPTCTDWSQILTCVDMTACSSTAYDSFNICVCLGNCFHQCNIGAICWCHSMCAQVDLQSGTVFHCYCSLSGAPATCSFQCLHSLTDTFGTQTVLDPAGCLNWIATAYS